MTIDKLSYVFILILLFFTPLAHAGDVKVIPANDSFSFVGVNSSILPVEQEANLTAPIPNEKGQHFDEYDAGSDMVAVGTWQKGPTVAADDIYEYFGKTRGFIFSYITYNVDPEKIPIAKDYNNMNQNMAVIMAVLFVLGEGLASSVASSNYPAYRNVFGEKDFSQKKYVGGGISIIAGLGASWIFRGVMTFINLLDAYLMISVMEAIKPSVDNGIMYFCLAVIEILLFVFFFYRQILIVAMYIASPIFGVMWASGYMKEFVDSIGDKFVRALIMQPLTIFITIVSIIVMKAMEADVLGITIWEGDDEMTFYVILLAIILYACWWCLFGKMTIVKRSFNLLIKKKVYGR